MKEDFVAYVNNMRKANRNNWYSGTYTEGKKTFKIKGFKTWLQVARFSVDGGKEWFSVPTSADISVKQFIAKLEEMWDSAEAMENM